MNTPLAGRRPAEILLVEDNQGDVVLARESFKRVAMPINLHQVDNGEQCLAFLRKEDPYADVPTPDIVLLDLNMPGMDGREALAHIVADPALRHLPVIILTTAANEDDVRQVYELRCNSYLIKPLTFVEFQQAIDTLCDYWFNNAVLPSSA